MQKSTFDSILLLGNHSHLFYKDLIDQTKLPMNTLVFKKKDSFKKDDPHQFLYNNVSIDFNGAYVLDELSFALSILINHNKELQNVLVLGDPSELFYQAFVFAKTNQNPHFIRQEVQFIHELSHDAYVFVYPVGMVAQNIRKEISQLVYVLKKCKQNTFLIRSENNDPLTVLQKLLNSINGLDELFTFDVKEVQPLISNHESFST